MRVHFSTDDLPPRDREPCWLDFYAEHVVHMTPRDRPNPGTFRAELDGQVIGRFTCFDFHTSHELTGRTAADVSRDDFGAFVLRRVSREQIYSMSPVRAGTEEVRLARGDLCVSSV